MTLVVKCVICHNPIPNPTCYSETCGVSDCREKYQRYLVWLKREKAKKNKKAKDYKVVKIIKTKRKTKK